MSATPGTRAAPYAPFTTVAANADVDTYLPTGGRSVTGIPTYLENNAVFNVGDYMPGGTGLPTNGTTDISPGLNAAIADATAAGGGNVRLPWTVLGYNIGTASPGVAVPSNVTLECLHGALTLTYSGTGIAIDTLGSSYAQLRNIYAVCPNDAASGIRYGGSSLAPSRWCRLENVTVQGSGTVTNTGTAFILDSGPQYCAYLNGRQVYGLGFKYGMDVIGQSAGSHTWTTVTVDMLVLVGRAAGVVPGSRGIRTDANSNLQGSYLPGVVIEGFEQSTEFASGSPCFGFNMTGGIEGNTTNYALPPATYAGRIEDYHGSYAYQQMCNGVTNRWIQELIQSGTWTTESRNSRLHALYDGSAVALLWGVQRGGSPIAGEFATDKFIASTGAQGDVGVLRNWYKFLEYKVSFSNAIPTVGSWGKGSVIWNTSPAAGVPLFWVCDSSGTLKTSPGCVASTTNGSPTVSVDTLSTLERNDYITIAGAYATPTRIKSISGTTLTMESNAAGGVIGIAVVFPAPTFNIIAASKASAVADVGTLATTETSGATYTANEQSMLTHLKADVTSLRTTVNALLAARRSALEQA